MSSASIYPGVYIQELPSPMHAITSLVPSIAAFVGYTAHGSDNRAEAILSFADFERLYGRLAPNSEESCSPAAIEPVRLAQRRVTGGAIRNIALPAALIAANEGSAVTNALAAACTESSRLDKPL